MARDKALYVGPCCRGGCGVQRREAAEAALELIDVAYEPLPWVIDVDEAMRPDAPVLHDFLGADRCRFRIAGRPDQRGKPNGASRLVTPTTGFAAADVVIERHFKTKPVHQGYIEPHACLVSVASDGRATIWSSSQGPVHGQKRHRPKMTGARLSDIRAIPAEIGGGFGGKTIVYSGTVGLHAVAQGRRGGEDGDDARGGVSAPRDPPRVRRTPIKIGARRDGRIVAAEATFRFQAGAFPGSPVRAASNCAFAPYAIDNVKVVGYDVVMNRPKCNAYRAPGSPIAAFGVEAVIDELARELDHRSHRLPPPGTPRRRARERRTARPSVGSASRRRCEAARKRIPHYAAPKKGVARDAAWLAGSGSTSAASRAHRSTSTRTARWR